MDKRGRDRRLAAGAALSMLLLSLPAAAAGPQRSSRDDVVLSLKDKAVRDLSSKGLTLAFHIGVANQAAAARDLVRYRYRVTVNQKEFLNMTVELPAPLSAPPGRETLIALPVRISYELLFAAVGPIEERAACDIVGDMYFLTERNREQRVPFAYSGEFPIFKDPEVEILPLKVNDLTVGGADVVFSAVFRNLNGYELLVDRIGFRLAFAGLEVLSGEVPGDKSLPRNADKVFTIPFLIDFFEAGDKMRGEFQKAELACLFEGEIEIASAWGRLRVRFDKAQSLRFE